MTLASPLHQNVTVLIADDCLSFRLLLRSQLEAYGFQSIVEASDGLDAIAKAVESHPDLVLLDIAMPGLNGIEAAARIRLHAPQSKITFVSQNTDPDIAQSALSDGVRGYVLKSRIAHELRPAIDAVLNGTEFITPGLRPASF